MAEPCLVSVTESRTATSCQGARRCSRQMDTAQGTAVVVQPMSTSVRSGWGRVVLPICHPSLYLLTRGRRGRLTPPISRLPPPTRHLSNRL